MKYTSLANGERYTLEQLFSEDNKIIIPDLQRDYCWFEQDTPLVSNFISGLIDRYENSEYPLGLIYGYEYPAGHIQLCDGQQRITTLFLLVGLLHRRTKHEYLRRMLISDFEMKDDYEPHLQYAIRESTLYFLSDLTRRFFIGNPDLAIDDIRKQTWYFHDYDLDPSIRNMIGALRIIDQELNSKIESIDIDRLCAFIARKISFLYYDLKSRSNGEETFVIINTTGEPLSVTENLKPHIISRMPVDEQQEGSRKWEEMETWFWQHRGQNDTADNGLLEFFNWMILLSGKSNIEMKEIPLETLWSYFTVIRRLFDDPGILYEKDNKLLSPDSNGNTQIDRFRILPVIEYAHGFGFENERDILRVKNYFGHLAEIPNIGRDIQNLLPKAIEIVKNMKRSEQRDIAAYIVQEQDAKIGSAFRSEEELFKFGLYLGTDCRDSYENLFWEAEEHGIWSGEIKPLLQWSKPNDKFSIERFRLLNDTFNTLFSREDLDETRRALLAWGLDDYPRIFSGYTNYSFCSTDSDWKTLIAGNVEKFGKFVEFLSGETDIQAAQRRIIEEYSGDSEWIDFIKDPEFLRYCKNKNIQKWGNNIGLIKQTRATTYVYAESYKLYLNLFNLTDEEVIRVVRNGDEASSILYHNLEFRYDPERQSFRICTKAPEVADKYGLTDMVNGEFSSEPKSRSDIEKWFEEMLMESK